MFDEENCISKLLDYLLTLKGESKKFGKKIFEYCFQMHAHNGTGFDTWNV